jgi:hypothetical protein
MLFATVIPISVEAIISKMKISERTIKRLGEIIAGDKALSTALLNDPERCVPIGDRESDIYELFCTAQVAGTHFLVRTCVDRLAGDGKHTIAGEMKEVCIKGFIASR